MKIEIKVGIFILLSLISLFLVLFYVDKFDFDKKGYILYGIIDDATGINKKSRVKLRGITVGFVKDIKLIENGVKLTFFIKEGVKIPKNSYLTISQESLVGTKFVKIIPSNFNEYYTPYETISNYQKIPSTSQILSSVNNILVEIEKSVKKINNILNNENIEKMRSILENTDNSLNKLSLLLETFNKKVPKMLISINSLINTYIKLGKNLNNKTNVILSKVNKVIKDFDILIQNGNSTITSVNKNISLLTSTYNKVGKNINSFIDSSKKEINTTIYSVKQLINKGSESLDNINQILSNINNSQLVVDFSSNYLFKENNYLTNIDLIYKPNPLKYYIGGVKIKEENNKTKYLINLQIGKRYDNLLLKGGLIENYGGVGIDYFMLKDRLKFSMDLYDFNGKENNNKIHFNSKISYYYLKHLEFIAGVDNILNKNLRSFFLGIGIKFIDNDLKSFAIGGASSFLK